MDLRAPAPTYGNVSRHAGPLSGIRICDLSGQLAGAAATRMMAAFGAQVIRIEDPVTRGMWDIVRQMGPYLGDDRSGEGGAGFNNHNVEKLGITIDLRQPKGKALLTEIIKVSDAVTENFAAGVMDRLGFGYEQLTAIKPDIVYVSNCGFGQQGPYRTFKSWGPIAQAVSGLTWSSGLPDQQPAGWGFSYMDHTGGYVMGIALLAALWHRHRTGEGQWVDLSCSEAGIALNGPALLDATVNQRAMRRPGQPHSNRSTSPLMAPHGIYPCQGDDEWIAIACRDDGQWTALAALVGADPGLELEDRVARQDALDATVEVWTSARTRAEAQTQLRAAGVTASGVARPPDRGDGDADNQAWGMWPTATHTRHGQVRVDGLPVHLSASDWKIEHGGPLLGEHTDRVLTDVLGLSAEQIDELRAEKVI